MIEGNMLLLLAGTAFAQGPLLTAGAVWTPALSVSGGSVGPFLGPTARAGWEFGNRWNHEVAFQFSHAGAVGEAADTSFDVGVTTYGVGYRFAVDILGKQGLSPYVGLGSYLGWFEVITQDGDLVLDTSGVLLEFHLALGARYCFDNGLNLRAEVAGSTYGGLWGIEPSIGAGWQF
jgi:hypothetical protein